MADLEYTVEEGIGTMTSHAVPVVLSDDPNTGLPSPPIALHQPHSSPGISISTYAVVSTEVSTNGTGHT